MAKSFGHHGASLVIGLTALTLAASQAIFDDRLIPLRADHLSAGACIVNDNFYRDGQIFTIPGWSQCTKYRCSNAAVSVFEEACEHRGSCYPVGSTVDESCKTYTCTPSTQNGNTCYMNRTRTRCADYLGICRDPGTRFPYYMRGRFYRQCTCAVGPDGYFGYMCNEN